MVDAYAGMKIFSMYAGQLILRSCAENYNIHTLFRSCNVMENMFIITCGILHMKYDKTI